MLGGIFIIIHNAPNSAWVPPVRGPNSKPLATWTTCELVVLASCLSPKIREGAAFLYQYSPEIHHETAVKLQ